MVAIEICNQLSQPVTLAIKHINSVILISAINYSTLGVVGVEVCNAWARSTGPPTADGVLYVVTGARERYEYA